MAQGWIEVSRAPQGFCSPKMMASGCLVMALLTSASALVPNASMRLTDSMPTLDGVNVCNSDHPTLKLSFGNDTMRIQWERKGDSKTPSRHLNCTVDYSIAYSGSDPWYEGHVTLPATICGEKLPIRIHVHSSFENLDFHEKVDGNDKKLLLKREMKDGVDHCGRCDVVIAIMTAAALVNSPRLTTAEGEATQRHHQHRLPQTARARPKPLLIQSLDGGSSNLLDSRPWFQSELLIQLCIFCPELSLSPAGALIEPASSRKNNQFVDDSGVKLNSCVHLAFVSLYRLLLCRCTTIVSWQNRE